MKREYAINLLQEAIDRLKCKRYGGTDDESTGGAYWRLAQVLELYLNPRMDKTEGKKHSNFIRETHGVICRQAAVELRRLHAENQDLQDRVQELGEMARENRSKRVIELEQRIAEMEAVLSAVGEKAALDYLKRHGLQGNPLRTTTQGLEQPIKWPKARDVGRFGDMSPDGSIRVGLDADNDVYVSIFDGTSVADIEFCTPGGGGGRSSRTRMALIALMCAIEADNASHPAFDFWQRNLAAQAKQGE